MGTRQKKNKGEQMSLINARKVLEDGREIEIRADVSSLDDFPEAIEKINRAINDFAEKKMPTSSS